MTNNWIRLGAVLLGGALGAACAIFSIEFFDTTATQLGSVAACAIFGGLTSVIASAGIPLGAIRKFQDGSRLKNLGTARLVRLKCVRAEHLAKVSGRSDKAPSRESNPAARTIGVRARVSPSYPKLVITNTKMRQREVVAQDKPGQWRFNVSLRKTY